MPTGKVGGLHGGMGQLVSEGNYYYFEMDSVEGFIQNGQEVTFELASNGSVKVIYGDGAKKPKNAPKPKQKENTAKADNRELLTEDK
tara:strand:- start:1022 stop:1282 length:261 start_codon:yes stop_codon:yes gene_type:complete